MTVGRLSESAADLLRKGRDLSQLPGIGKDLAGKVEQIVTTGRLAMLDTLKKVKILHEKLGITSLADLGKAAADKRIRKLRGFGEKTEKKILAEIKRVIYADLWAATNFEEYQFGQLGDMPSCEGITADSEPNGKPF